MAVHVTRAGVALTVGIIVLTGLIIGALIWVKESGEQARREEAIAVAEQNLQEETTEEIALNEGESADEEVGQPPASNADETSPRPTGETGTAPQQAVDALPETGPADLLIEVAIVTALSFSIVSYITSRRHVYNKTH